MPNKEDFDARDHFGDEHATVYDEKIRQVILGYDEMHDLSYYLLKDVLDADANILVSGVGTGHEALTYAQNSPGWIVTGVDPTSEMVHSTREKTARLGLESRVKICEGTVANLEKTGFDAATSINRRKDCPHRPRRREGLRGVPAPALGLEVSSVQHPQRP